MLTFCITKGLAVYFFDYIFSLLFYT